MVEDNLKNMKRCPVIPTLHLLLSSGEIFSVYLGIPSQSWSWKIKTKGWTALHYSDSTKNFYNVDESYNSAIELGLLHSEKRMVFFIIFETINYNTGINRKTRRPF